jgi:predicted dehydrogenase/nucleoside-diphosphate-sugar epimerase
MESGSQRRICLIGAGNVSRTHAEALRQIPGAELVAVCDVDADRANLLASEMAVEHVFSSVSELVASDTCDFAHVLVPPGYHLEVAEELVDGNIGTFLEKPMGSSSAICRSVVMHADARGLALGVNHNAVFYPAHVKLRRQVEAREFGALQHLMVLVNFPRSTLAPPGHWMLQGPENVVFESGVHPLSQIYDLSGPLLSADTTVSGRRKLPSGSYYFDTWQMSMLCERATAQLFLSYGGSYRTWLEIAICEDGILTAEVETSSATASGKTRWGPYIDLPAHAVSVARQELLHGIESLGREARAAIQPSPRRDPYFASMRDSIASFYNGSSTGMPKVDGAFGAEVVSMCEAVTKRVAGRAPARPAPASTHAMARPDAVVLGGSGFIGRALVDQMVGAGMTIRVMARNPLSSGEGLRKRQVETCTGDIADPDAVRGAIKGARFVVHLAHGGRFEWEALNRTMIRPARYVAEACLQHGVERMLYTGTIASLYLGNPNAVLTGATPLDPQLKQRGPYEWGKAQCEALLLSRFNDEPLPVCIVRPGIVLGKGGTPFHGGFGIWRGDIHCIGWNLGRNPLPLVLASDVATAIMLALESPRALGKTYNLVGDVRLSARECVCELRAALQRPLMFHPRYSIQHQSLQMSKWLVKHATGRNVRFPSYRGIKSMGCLSQLDCSDVKQDLGWTPLRDRDRFIDEGLRVYATRG